MSFPYAPTRIVRGESRDNRVIDPFQYYTEAGEQIFRAEFARQAVVARVYAHFDAKGRQIASLALDGDGARLPERPLSAEDFAGGEEGYYGELLTEMHVLAQALPGQMYDSSELQHLRGLLPEPPVIVGGCGRSGTTLLLSILAAHPQILGIPEELYAFYPFPFRLRRVIDNVEALASNEHTRWCEKTPKNVRAFSQIGTAFEDEVALIHIVRDGRDVVTSHHPNHEQQYWVSPERWVSDVTAGLEAGEDVELVRYEDLVRAPEKTLRGLCEFIDVPFEASMLEPEKNSSVKSNVAWGTQSLEAISQSSVGRWQDAKHAQRVDDFMAYPGVRELMSELGYVEATRK